LKKDSTSLYYVSRNFVEFGGFTALEIAAFSQRGILTDHDYIRSADGQDWQPVSVWLTGEPKPAVKTAPRKRTTSTAKAPKKAA
jgi:hypothetical protein